MACCKAIELGWCKDLTVVDYKDEKGNEYCVFHAPKEHKGISANDFNKEVQKKLNDFKEIPEVEREGLVCDFSGTVFISPTDFKNYELPPVTFRDAKFTAGVNFFNSTFSGKADFFNSAFESEAYFDESTFKEANFHKATFNKEASFFKTKFKEKTNFLRATFEEKAFFVEASFTEADFRDVKLKGVGDFREAVFTDVADFKVATFEGEASFDEAVFAKGIFERSTFLKRADFREAVFCEANFAEASFKGIAAFAETLFEEVSFSRTTITEGIFFESRFTKEADFRRVVIVRNLKFQNIKMYQALFLESDLRACDFINCTWDDSRERYRLYDELKLEKDKKKLTHEQLKDSYRKVENLYRAQKQKSGQNHNQHDYSLWHLSEKEMMLRRTGKETCFYAAMLWLYKETVHGTV